MTHEQFIKFRNALDSHCSSLLNDTKRKEYDYEDIDRLSQFKRAGALKSEHPVLSLCGMMVKHETSIHDMARAINSGEVFTKEKWMEKLGDLRNYCDLCFALLYDTGEI